MYAAHHVIQHSLLWGLQSANGALKPGLQYSAGTCICCGATPNAAARAEALIEQPPSPMPDA